MNKINKKLTLIKYGSSTLVTKSNTEDIAIDTTNIKAHGSLIDAVTNPVIIVSSGAVAFGKSLGQSYDYITDEIIRKRIFAALGNPHLSVNWDQAIPNKQVLQSLITHRDLTSDLSKEKILEIIHALFSHQNGDAAIIQVNDNDFITDEELLKIRHGEFGDNDQTTALLAILCNHIFEEIEVIINTTSDGVLDGNQLLTEIHVSQLTDAYIDQICGTSKTNLGTGGMQNKLKIIRYLIENTTHVAVHVINGKKTEHLQMILEGKSIGTKIYK